MCLIPTYCLHIAWSSTCASAGSDTAEVHRNILLGLVSFGHFITRIEQGHARMGFGPGMRKPSTVEAVVRSAQQVCIRSRLECDLPDCFIPLYLYWAGNDGCEGSYTHQGVSTHVPWSRASLYTPQQPGIGTWLANGLTSLCQKPNPCRKFALSLKSLGFLKPKSQK